MILLVSEENGIVIRVRAYDDQDQFWRIYDEYDEVRYRLSFEKPRVNLDCTYGHKVEENTIFPVYFIPGPSWVSWKEFLNSRQTRKFKV